MCTTANNPRRFLSTLTLQKDPEGYVSCGPICVELLMHWSVDRIVRDSIFEQLIGDNTVIKHGLTYTPIDISSHLPSILQTIHKLSSEDYLKRLKQLRANHLEQLQTMSYLQRLIDVQLINTYWDNCLHSSEQTVFHQLVFNELKLLNLDDSKDYQNLVYRLVANVQALKAYDPMISEQNFSSCNSSPAPRTGRSIVRKEEKVKFDLSLVQKDERNRGGKRGTHEIPVNMLKDLIHYSQLKQRYDRIIANLSKIERKTQELLNKNPSLSLDEAIILAENIIDNKCYKSTKIRFPQQFPWRYFLFSTFTGGGAYLRIYFRDILYMPRIHDLLVQLAKPIFTGFYPYSYGTFGDRFDLSNPYPRASHKVEIRFQLGFSDYKGANVGHPENSQKILEIIYDLLNRLSHFALTTEAQIIFRKTREKLHWVLLEYFKDFINNFPPFDNLYREIRLGQTVPELSQIAAPHHTRFNRSSYVFKLANAVTADNHKTLINMLANEIDVDSIYLSQTLLHQAVTVLYVYTKDKLKKRLETIKILLYYHANPKIISDGEKPIEIAIRRVHNHAHSNDDIYKEGSAILEYYKNLIKMLLFAEYNMAPNNFRRFHVCTYMETTPLGRLVKGVQDGLWNTNRIAPTIKRITESCHEKDGFVSDILTMKNKIIKLGLKRLHELTQNEKNVMFSLLKSNYPWQGKMTETELSDYFYKEILEDSGYVIIDLLYVNNEIKAYNVAEIYPKVTVEKRNVVLNYAALSIIDSSLSACKKLMAIILLQRGFALKLYYLRRKENVDVITVMEAASIHGFLLATNLRFYPKYLWVNKALSRYIKEVIYPKGIDIIQKVKYPQSIEHNENISNEIWYVRDKLSIAGKRKNPDITSLRALTKDAYYNLFKKGYSIVMFIKNDMSNLIRLCMEINPYIAEMSFEYILDIALRKVELLHNYMENTL